MEGAVWLVNDGKAGLADIKTIVDAELKKQFPNIAPEKEGESEAAKKIRAGIAKTKTKGS